MSVYIHAYPELFLMLEGNSVVNFINKKDRDTATEQVTIGSQQNISQELLKDGKKTILH